MAVTGGGETVGTALSGRTPGPSPVGSTRAVSPGRSASQRSFPGSRPRIVSWAGVHPRLADACLVLVLAVLTGGSAVLYRDPWPGAAFQVALWFPVVFRRRAPIAVFLLVGVVAAVQWAVSAPVGGDLAVLVVLYTVAAHRGRNLAVAGAVAVEIGVVMAVARFGGEMWARLLLLLTIPVIAAFLLGISQQSRRSYLAALVDRADRLEREADQQAQLATAAERTRIAREMHDIVAHSLSVMVALADGAALTDELGQARLAMQQVARTGREALADTRRVLGVLRTDTDSAQRAPLPGLDALDSLLATVRSTGLHTELQVTGAVFAVPTGAQVAIYRIVQEGLTNTIKHAHHADHAVVRVSYRHPEVVIDILDNGTHRASPSPTTAGRSAHGLLGVRERAAVFGGTCDAGWADDGGWQITATLQFPDTVPPRAISLDS